MNAPTIILKALGIQDLEAELKAGRATAQEVFDIVRGRIEKRTAEGKSLIPAVVEYHNRLAPLVNAQPMPVPDYGNKQAPAPIAAPALEAAGANAKEIAKFIKDKGIDPAAVVAELARQ